MTTYPCAELVERVREVKGWLAWLEQRKQAHARVGSEEDTPMIPGNFALTLYRGDSMRWQFVLWNDAEKTDPADLTGVTATAQIRDKPGGTFVVDLDCTVTLPNIIDAELTADKAATLPAKGQWDLQLTYASGDVATVLAGAVTATADITTATVVGRGTIEPHQQAKLAVVK